MRFVTLAMALAFVGPGPSDSHEPLPARLQQAQAGKVEPATPPVIPAINDRLRKYIVAKEIAGAVTLVATPNRVIHLDALGNAVLSPDEPMQTDAIFWIASM